MIGFFDDYFIEGYFNGSWVDIKEDIVSTIHVEYGIFGNQILDRVGDIGSCTFLLDNNETNSAGLVGYYSPGHVNCRNGFKPGLSIRVRFQLDGQITQKWIGKIPAKDGIKVTSGNYSNKTVAITVKDWIYTASTHPIKGMALATYKTLMEGVALVLVKMPEGLQPPGVVNYRTAESTFPTLFDTNKATTTALSEFGKMVQSEVGFIYMTRQGLKVEGRLTRNEEKTSLDSYPKARSELNYLAVNSSGDYLVDGNGKKLLISATTQAIFDNIQSDADISYGDGYYNSAKFRAYPRKLDVDPTTTLFTLQSPMYIEAGATVVISGGYKDPTGISNNVSGTDMVVPETPTHYQAFENADGSGADLSANLVVSTVDPITSESTLGTGEFKCWITNSGAAGYITKFDLVGRGIYTDIPVEYYEEEADDIEEYGPSPLVVDMKYQSDPLVASRWAKISLFQTKTLRSSINEYRIKASVNPIYLYAFLFIEPGMRVRMKEDVTGVYSDFIIQGVKFDIFLDGSIEFSWVPRAVGLDTFNFVKWSPTSTPVEGYGVWDDPVYGWDF